MCHVVCTLRVYDLTFMWGGEEDACWVTRNKVRAWRRVSAEKKNGIFSETLNNFQPGWRYRVLIFLQDLETSLAVMVNEAGYFWREFRTSLAAFVVTESCIFNKTSWQILADIDIFGTSPAVCGDQNTFLSLFPDQVVLKTTKPEVSTSTALSQDTTYNWT